MKVRCEACRTVFEPVIQIVQSVNKDEKYDMLGKTALIQCHICGRRYYPISWKSDRPLTILEGGEN